MTTGSRWGRLFCVGALGAAAALTACGGDASNGATASAELAKATALTAATLEGHGALTEQIGSYLVSWLVEPDGHVAVGLRTSDGQPITEGVEGELSLADPSGSGLPQKRALVQEGEVMQADFGALPADLVELRYALVVKGEPVTGVLDVPRGGTPELAEAARAEKEAAPEGPRIGPHGGTLQVVGPDTIEIVAAKTTGEVRVYVLDAKLQPTTVGTRKVRLALAGEQPTVVVLAPAADGAYLSAKLDVNIAPVKTTVVVENGPKVYVALCGHRHGDVFLVDHHHPRFGIFVVDDFRVVVHEHDDDKHHHHHHDKVKVKIKDKGKGTHVDIKIH